MSLRKSMAVAVRDAQAQVYADFLDAGYVRVYGCDPEDVPATVADPLGPAVMLAELTFGSPGFGAPAGGSVLATPINEDPSTNADGTARFYRTFRTDGVSAVEQGEVGTSDAAMIVPTTTIVAGIEFKILSFRHTVP